MSDAPGAIPTFSTSDFDSDRLLHPGRFAAAAVAAWCPFCDEFLPRFVRRAPPPGWRWALLDLTDTESPLWEALRVEVVPSILGFEDGAIVGRLDGTRNVGLSDRDLDRLAERLGASPAPGSG